MRSFQVRALKLMETLNKQEQSFGIIILMVLTANGAEPKILHVPFVIPLSLGLEPLLILLALHLEPLLILLVELFSDKRDRILELVVQYVKRMIIVMHNSEMLRKLSTKKSLPRNNTLAPATTEKLLVVYIYSNRKTVAWDNE